MRRHPRPHGPPGHPRIGHMRPLRGPPPPPPPPYLGGPHGPGMRMPPPPVMAPSGAVSSVTNANDPISMDSRLFVGNLNTVALSKEDVDDIFGCYGAIVGISVHKGYAFVQFDHPDEARRAGLNENGKMYEGQALDINIVSQPKNRSALKRATTARTVNDTTTKKPRQDAPGTNQSLQRTLVTLSSSNTENHKKTTENKTVTSGTLLSSKATEKRKSLVRSAATVSQPSSRPVSEALTSISTTTTDILICGNCKMQFSSVSNLVQHKKAQCHLQFSCQCHNNLSQLKAESDEPSMLQCATCDAELSSAWALCQHYAAEHNLSIFREGGQGDMGDFRLAKIENGAQTLAE